MRMHWLVFAVAAGIERVPWIACNDRQQEDTGRMMRMAWQAMIGALVLLVLVGCGSSRVVREPGRAAP